MTIQQRLYSNRYAILGIIFLAHLLMLWPGKFMPDSLGQYHEALKGTYSDHHPPIMAFVWHYLAKIHPGTGLMFALQLLMLYGGCLAMLAGFDRLGVYKKSPWLLLFTYLIPIYPSVLAYTFIIQKDNPFAFSFFLVAGVLSFCSLSNRSLRWYEALALLPFLLYGMAVKYQAQFCVVILLVWMSSRLIPNAQLWKKIALSIVLILIAQNTLTLINRTLVPIQKSSNSWEYVKLFDIASISVATGHDYIPDFNKTEAYTFTKVQQRFTHEAIDPMVYVDENILRKTTDPIEMAELKSTWWNTVLEHPGYYFKHRITTLGHVLCSRIGYMHVDKFVQTKFSSKPEIAKTLLVVSGSIWYVFMTILPLAIAGIFYLYMSIRAWKITPAAPVLFGYTSLALSMIGILLFMTMAGTQRYAYISLLMLQGSHLFAFVVYKKLREHSAVTAQSSLQFKPI